MYEFICLKLICDCRKGVSLSQFENTRLKQLSIVCVPDFTDSKDSKNEISSFIAFPSAAVILGLNPFDFTKSSYSFIQSVYFGCADF